MGKADLSSDAGAVAPLNDARAFNRRAVLALAMAQGVLTRHDAAAMSGLSKATVSRVVRELVAADVLLEGPASSRGLSGRPTTSLIFNANCAWACGVSLSSDGAVDVSLADARGVVFHQAQHRLGGSRAGHAARKLATHIVSRLPSADVPVAVTIGVPARVRSNAVVAESRSTEPESAYAALASELRCHLAADVDIVSETDLAVLGEVWGGAARGSDSAVYLSVEPAPRAGVYLNGALLRGRNGLVGEFGAIAYGSGMSVEDHLLGAISRQDRDEEETILYFLCEIIASAYSPEVIVLSSDPVIGGPAAVSRLARRFAASGPAQLPRLVVGELGPRASVLGAQQSAVRRVEQLLLGTNR
ncbi:ROK family protein [Mycolicibacterium sp.]|uniref:ROK family protein n=1 Tax=Mycolicibacterium sp. TaxID=2320850 RepID=UPI0037C7E76C